MRLPGGKGIMEGKNSTGTEQEYVLGEERLMRGIDAYDSEVAYGKDNRLNVGILFSFKSMSLITERLVEETKEYDDKYPKSELLKIWGCAMMMLFFLFLFSYKLFLMATLPFMFFYGYALMRVFKAWKRFHYKKGGLMLATIFGVMLELVVGIGLQTLLLG